MDRLCLARGSPPHIILGYVGFAFLTNQAMRSLILTPRFPEDNHRYGKPRPSTTGARFLKGNNTNLVTSSKAQGYPILYIVSMRFALVNKIRGQSLAANSVTRHQIHISLVIIATYFSHLL